MNQHIKALSLILEQFNGIRLNELSVLELNVLRLAAIGLNRSVVINDDNTINLCSIVSNLQERA